MNANDNKLFGYEDDVRFDHDGERIEVAALTENGEAFLDAYTGPLLEVIDVGRIVIPKDALPDFIETARENAVAIAE